MVDDSAAALRFWTCRKCARSSCQRIEGGSGVAVSVRAPRAREETGPPVPAAADGGRPPPARMAEGEMTEALRVKVSSTLSTRKRARGRTEEQSAESRAS